MNRAGKAKYFLAASVALVTFFAYLPALRNEFVYWDDNLYIFENPDVRSLDAAFFLWAFLGFHVSNWHPLTWVSHAVDYTLWGLNPLGHHLTNIILHAANAALVVLLSFKLIETARERSAQNASSPFLRDRAILIAAGVTGLLFGIHPVHVESVAWVSERKDLLCALFFLLSVIAYVQSAERIAGSAESKRLTPCAMRYALCFFVLALLSKPMAVSLPAVLLILDWYPLGRVRSWKTLRTAIIEKLLFIALSLVSSVMTILAQRTGEALVSVEQIPFSLRVLVAAKSIGAYLGKMLLPVNLLPFYPYPKDISLFSVENLLAIGLVIGITLVCAGFAGKQKFWLSAWGYYIVTLIPVLGIVQVGVQSMADRYSYLPSLGPFLIAGLCAAWATEKIIEKRQNAIVKIVLGIAASLAISFLVYSTLMQIRVWHDDFSLWDHAIKNSPQKVSMFFTHRGIAFGKKGNTDRAIVDLEAAIVLNPNNYDAYMNLSVAFEKTGRPDKALENVEKAISVKPASHEAYLYRGVLYEETGQLDKAIEDYTKAIALAPDDFEAYNNRGTVFGKTGQLDKAIADYSETIRLNPRHIEARSNRGVAYTLTGQYDRALEDFNMAVVLSPNDPMMYFNRGSFYRKTGNNAAAVADFQKACDMGDARACGILHQLKRPAPG